MSHPLLLLVPAAVIAPIDFDLRAIATSQRCLATDTDEILVCARRSMSDRQRVRTEPERYIERPVVAEVALPNGWKANLHADSQELPGATSKRAMVTLKIPF